MNVEQRLIEVFQTSNLIEPTPDLFSRVLHSIDEDRRHRQRVARTVAVLVAALAAVVVVGALSIVDGRLGRFVDRSTMEALEFVGLFTVIAGLGPAIRRFGRNYAADLWPRGAVTPGSLLQLLDLAFYLVGTGYVFVTTEFAFADSEPAIRLADQLGDAAARFGGLLLLLGVLHASMLFLLPIVALVHNSTRRDVKLPRWVVVLVIAAGLATMFALQAAVGLGISLST